VLAHSRPLLARVKAVQADVAALAEGEAGRVGVATFQSFGARVLPAVLGRFRALRPDVEVSIRELLGIDVLLASIETGECDVGFAPLPLDEGPFETLPLFADPYVLVTRAGGEERTLRDLAGRRVLGIKRCRHEQLVEASLLSAGIAPLSTSRFDDNGMIQALAASGEGIAVVPELAVDPGDPRVSVHPLPELPARQLVAVWHRERVLGAAARQFLETAAELCAERPAA
jgi:DNA-binding transcriptional LysR family regulator